MVGKYIPPNVKEQEIKYEYKPVKLNLNVDIKYKTKNEIFEKYMKENNGMADDAWEDNYQSNGVSNTESGSSDR